MGRLLKGTAIAVILAVCYSCTVSLFADTITLKRDENETKKYSVPMNGSTGNSLLKYSTVVDVDDATAREFHVFCADETQGLGGFDSTGLPYGANSLVSDTGFSSDQKNLIQDLYNHMYAAVVDSIVSDKYSGGDNVMVGIFQYCLWEIIHDIGDMTVATAGAGDMLRLSNSTTEFAKSTQSVLDALNPANKATWDDLSLEGYDLSKVTQQNLTIFNSSTNDRQRLISSDYDPWIDPSGGVTPEPSTLAIFGLGLLGAGWTARRKKS